MITGYHQSEDLDGNAYVDLTLRFTALPTLTTRITFSATNAVLAIDSSNTQEKTNNITFNLTFVPPVDDKSHPQICNVLVNPDETQAHDTLPTNSDSAAAAAHGIPAVAPEPIDLRADHDKTERDLPIVEAVTNDESNDETSSDETGQMTTKENIPKSSPDIGEGELPRIDVDRFGDHTEDTNAVGDNDLGLNDNGLREFDPAVTAAYERDNRVADNDAKDDQPPLSAERLLGPDERLIVARLLRVPTRVRAMHAYIVGLFVDGGTIEGRDLRANIVSALSASVINPVIAGHWMLVPMSIRQWLKDGAILPSEIEAVAILAEILAHERLDPTIIHYLEAVKLSFGSIAELDQREANDRLFSRADRLDDKFHAAFPSFGST